MRELRSLVTLIRRRDILAVLVVVFTADVVARHHSADLLALCGRSGRVVDVGRSPDRGRRIYIYLCVCAHGCTLGCAWTQEHSCGRNPGFRRHLISVYSSPNPNTLAPDPHRCQPRLCVGLYGWDRVYRRPGSRRKNAVWPSASIQQPWVWALRWDRRWVVLLRTGMDMVPATAWLLWLRW